jgi:hypothetical protein
MIFIAHRFDDQKPAARARFGLHDLAGAALKVLV